MSCASLFLDRHYLVLARACYVSYRVCAAVDARAALLPRPARMYLARAAPHARPALWPPPHCAPRRRLWRYDGPLAPRPPLLWAEAQAAVVSCLNEWSVLRRAGLWTPRSLGEEWTRDMIAGAPRARGIVRDARLYQPGFEPLRPWAVERWAARVLRGAAVPGPPSPPPAGSSVLALGIAAARARWGSASRAGNDVASVIADAQARVGAGAMTREEMRARVERALSDPRRVAASLAPAARDYARERFDITKEMLAAFVRAYKEAQTVEIDTLIAKMTDERVREAAASDAKAMLASLSEDGKGGVAPPAVIAARIAAAAAAAAGRATAIAEAALGVKAAAGARYQEMRAKADELGITRGIERGVAAAAATAGRVSAAASDASAAAGEQLAGLQSRFAAGRPGDGAGATGAAPPLPPVEYTTRGARAVDAASARLATLLSRHGVAFDAGSDALTADARALADAASQAPAAPPAAAAAAIESLADALGGAATRRTAEAGAWAAQQAALFSKEFADKR